MPQQQSRPTVPSEDASTNVFTTPREWFLVAAIYFTYHSIKLFPDFRWHRLFFLVGYAIVLLIGVLLATHTAPPIRHKNRGVLRRAIDICGYTDAAWFQYAKIILVFSLALAMPYLMPRPEYDLDYAESPTFRTVKAGMKLMSVAALAALVLKEWLIEPEVASGTSAAQLEKTDSNSGP